MKKLPLIILVAIILSNAFCIGSAQIPSNNYRQELLDLKNNPSYSSWFDVNTPPELQRIHRNTETYKKLTLFQQIIRLGVDFKSTTVAISPNTLPKLHAYITKLCTEQGISMPTILLACDQSYYNASATKILKSSMIIIGSRLINETNDDQLEAVMAHELGHIKHNHTNKQLALHATVILGLSLLQGKLASKTAISTGTIITSALIIGKKFEREADKFACQQANKAEGLASFFEQSKAQNQAVDDSYVQTKKLIQANKSVLSWYNRSALRIEYLIAKSFHTFNRAKRYLYHHTPFGSHPADQDRIDEARRYLASQTGA